MSAAAGAGNEPGALFESLAAGAGDIAGPVAQRKMFGYPSAFVGGYLCFGLHENRLVLRLPRERRAGLLAAGAASEFAPRPGRTMTNFVAVEAPLSRDRGGLAALVAEAVAHAAALPPKPPRGR